MHGGRVNGIKRITIIDLTIPLDKSFIPFTSGSYADPSLKIFEWSSIQQEGFRVSQLLLGTQTGTHIDAPAHFLEDGRILDALSPEYLIGSYFLIDLPPSSSPADITQQLTAYQQQKIIFLRTPENQTARMAVDALQKILSLPPLLFVLSGEIEIDRSEPFEFYRLVARAGKYLAEDLDQKAARLVPDHGEIFVMPLRLIGTSGSPCRVIVKTEE